MLAVAWKEIKHILRDTRAFILTLIFPAFTVTFLGFALTLDVKEVVVGVMDMDGILGNEIVKRISGSPYFTTSDVRGVEAGRELLRRGKIDLFLKIPGDFTSRIITTGQAEVDVILDGSDNNSAVIAQGYLASFLFELKSTSPFSVQVKYLFNPELNSRIYFVSGLFGIFLFVLSVGMTAVAIVREKERGTFEMLMVTPLKGEEIIFGKVLPYMVIGVIDFLTGFLFAHLIFNLRCAGSFILLTALTVLFIATGIAMGVFISTVAESTMTAWLISFLVTVLPSFILSDFVFPTRSMPYLIEKFSYLIPAKYYMKILRSVILKGSPFRYLITETGVLMLFLTVFISASIVRMRRLLK